MPRLVFPAQPRGLIVDVVIGQDRDEIKDAIAAGRPIARPIAARGEIDTASNITAVSTRILRRLGSPVAYQTYTLTAAGRLLVNVHEISVGVRDRANPSAGELVEGKLAVMELTVALPRIEVLIGLDFLLGCKFLLDGPSRLFSLED